MVALQRYLIELINAAPPEQGGAVTAGVVFKTGQMVTGAIRIKSPGYEIDEKNILALFEIMTPGGSDPKSQPNLMISFFFTAESLERVVTVKPLEQPKIQPVTAGGIIIPS